MTIVFSSSSLEIAKWGIFIAKFEVLSAYMKLCTNLNSWAEKQSNYLASLNYVVTIVFSVSYIKQKNSKKIFYFLGLLFAFTKIFVFNDGQITEVEK